MNENRIRSICEPARTAAYSLMNVDRFYVMLYDRKLGQVSFPLVSENGNDLPEDQSPWNARNWNDVWLPDQIASRNVAAEGPDERSNYWPNEKPPASWLSMPMEVTENLRIVLVVENHRSEDAFGEDAKRFLTIIAQQTAMAIRNTQLLGEWQNAEKMRRAAERFAAINRISGEFAHQMNNMAGNIPVWVDYAKGYLDAKDPRQVKAMQSLTEIEKATQRLLKRAQEIREASQQRAREPLSVNVMVAIALKRAISSQPFALERIKVVKNLGEDLPTIEAERDTFLDTLTSIMRNGMEAMLEQGTLTVTTCRTQDRSRGGIEIRIQDTGEGIPASKREKIFEPFFTTKETGMGFGLWRDKAVIEELGGQILVDSEEKVGSTFTIRLPTS